MRTTSMLTTCIAACLIGLTSGRAAEPLEPVMQECRISFEGSKPDGTRHKGGFKKFTIEAQADFEKPENSSIGVKIDAASLWADDPRLEGHLKNPDFFNVRKYPKIVFESTEITAADEKHASIKGTLTMLGKKAELTIPADVEISEDSIKLSSKFKLDRFRWGMNYGDGQINREVDVTVHFEFSR